MKLNAGHKNYNRDTWQTMTRWFDSPLGQYLLQLERELLGNMLKQRFGYHLLQLGCSELLVHDASPMGHKFSFCNYPGFPTVHTAVARPESIPLASESVDLVLMHHALDFSDDQHQLLRDSARVVIAGGQLVIVGFNPLSSWGIRNRLQWLKRDTSPWNASLLSILRLSDWLKLLDFRIEQIRYGCYAWPVNSPRSIRYSGCLEGLASRLNWPTGGIYIIVARKQVIPLTPVQKHWSKLTVPQLGLPVADKAGRIAANDRLIDNISTNRCQSAASSLGRQ